MISAVNLAQRQTIQPGIQKQKKIQHKQINSDNVSFAGKPNWPAAGIIVTTAVAGTTFGVLGLANMVGDLQSIGVYMRNLIEITMGFGTGTASVFGAINAIKNKPPRYDFLEKYHLNK